MSTFGKSIRIYLKDGTVTGIKFGEVVNQTIQSISCPRLRVGELVDLPEANRPGVYFLFGEDEETGEAKAYIGEAENVRVRLQDHVYKKDFWNEVIFFVSKDENLTKSHVKYLESRLIQIAFQTRRYKTENDKKPQLSSLPLADRDAMEEFLTYIKLLIGVMGHKLLEEVTTFPGARKEDAMGPVNTLPGSTASNNPNAQLFLTVGGVRASALQTDEGIVVLKGSEATRNPTASISPGYKEMRERLVQNGILAGSEEKLVFQDDTLFNSPSAASCVILGYPTNGTTLWKNKAGKTFKEIESERMQTA
ncbi:GIY-YIG nuclease family protein [Flaviaesturariibacter amylovorans]|uniref:GIY-YIG nuclease family protein n=1 Tax=Flaviaesturariibacter amylovorans TaxID=1084520 RepID=A0ABP8HNM8_9BACT